MSKTKKNRNQQWAIVEQEFKGETSTPIECIYRASEARELCDSCHALLVLSEEGFQQCPACGIIYTDVIDSSPEWRYYGADDTQGADPARCGMPINPLLEESSYGCKITCSNKSSYEMRKLRRYTEWQSMPYREKKRFEDFQHIMSMSYNANITRHIIDDAIKCHMQLSNYNQSFRGNNKEGLLAGALYVACRKLDCPRTPKEIANIFKIDVAIVTEGCKTAQSILNELEQNSQQKTVFGKTRPELFIERYCSHLGINQELTTLCKFIAIKVEREEMMTENTPHSVSAAIIFLIANACNLNLNKHHIKEVTDVSEVTINKCFKKLETMNLIPQKMLAKYAPPPPDDSVATIK